MAFPHDGESPSRSIRMAVGPEGNAVASRPTTRLCKVTWLQLVVNMPQLSLEVKVQDINLVI